MCVGREMRSEKHAFQNMTSAVQGNTLGRYRDSQVLLGQLGVEVWCWVQ
jgi:hypothetical protein